MRKTKEEALKTRQYLLNAALEVFWRTGVTRASLQEIAQEAGVTRGALYWHFKNKEDLFEALFEQKYILFMSMMNDDKLNESTDVWAHLRSSLCELFRILNSDEKQRKFCHVMFTKCEQTENNQIVTELAQRYHAISRERIYRALELSVAQGKLPSNTDIVFSALYLESNLCGLVTMWANEPHRFDDLPATAQRIIGASMDVLQNGTFTTA
ncbi:TetR family transcriptional regulator [Wielerella bovis]|uniref:multidrug efflux system transcriptional repressor MtrR n=1 Tax=Wielerella bovis TaxID=2917790 RepID=UPI002018C282|nr:TetR family transcriptional regulator [Wielerella bovis]ULJ65356.1 TetR family transcriptional regulator [Wielerella bovis]ULJ67703.1 TetR family transcriptional regulator [Wielerella bovis]